MCFFLHRYEPQVVEQFAWLFLVPQTFIRRQSQGQRAIRCL
uniref:Uncharacterized protein n=1 Tax=Anguilla anguilla TaxID=7936 RepID=A0A0E9RUR8_ANGAN